MRNRSIVAGIMALAVVGASSAAFAVNAISVNAPGLNGTNNKLHVVVNTTTDDTTDAYVRTDHPNGETHYRMRFWIDPRNLPIAEGNAGTNHIRFFRVNDQTGTSLGSFIVGFITKSDTDHAYHWITWVKENDLVFRSRANLFLGNSGVDLPAQLEVEFTQGNAVNANFCARKIAPFALEVCRNAASNMQLSNGNVDFVDLGLFTNSNPSLINGSYEFDEFESYR